MGNPAAPLVRALTARVAGPRGRTSTAAPPARTWSTPRRCWWRAARLSRCSTTCDGAADAAAALADEHRATLMAGRTLLQQAVPITFGLKAAGWLVGLDAAARRLAAVRGARLAVQLGGAAGTLRRSATRAGGARVLARRARAGRAGAALAHRRARADRGAGRRAGRGRAARSARPRATSSLLAQTEVGEVREGGAGAAARRRCRTSATRSRRSPRSALRRQAPGLVATLLARMAHEHERAAGALARRVAAAARAARAAGSAAAWLRECLEHLEVDPERMRANLDRARRPAAGRARDRRAGAGAGASGGATTWSRRVAAQADERAAALPGAAGERPEIRDRLSAAELDALLDGATLPRQRRGLRRPRAGRARHDDGGAGAMSRRRAPRGRRARADAPVLVLSHSLGGTLEMWDPRSRRWRGLSRRALRPARPRPLAGAARPVRASPTSARTSCALLDRLGVARAHLCGLSLGGMVSLWVAAHHPERVDRLVVCCTSARAGAARAVGRARRGWCARRARRPSPTAVRRALVHARAARARTRRASRLRAMLAATPAEGYAACCGAIERMDLRAELRRDPRADAGHRGDRRSVDAARAPAAHRERDPGARAWRWSTAPPTWPTSSSPSGSPS